MLKEFRLQDPGEGVHEVEVLEILVKPGDRVEDGDTAFVVESDKAAIELPAPYDGIVKDIPVKVGDTVRVGELLMTVETEDEGEAAGAEAAEAPSQAAAVPAAPAAAASSRPAREGEVTIKAAPTARRLAKKLGIDLADVTPSGAHGHITKADVERHAERLKAGAPEAAPAAAGTPKAAAAEAAAPSERPARPARPQAPAELEEHIPLRSIRKATAEHMQRSWREIPHVVLEDRIDVTKLERFRRRHKAEVEAAGGKLTLLPFVIKATVATLRKHPRFNATIDMARGEIIQKHYYNIGVALDSARGLIVPVIPNADRMSVFEIALYLSDLIARVRDGKAGPEELQGGTFTVTNIGSLGANGLLAMINHPEVAILGMGPGRLEPVIVGDLDDYEVEARYVVPFTLTFDHRVNDGADGARFLATFRELLSDPEALALKA
ncbi:MAG: dihydrolipoamide acetyltransferase component of pyruvate dehydrogenase complex [Rhodothalassiaceae bacterium]|nr:MAG: dihydrolipoamide acetyltransferase component of pyruvate dehydrogenase complex [Rhodothalassiaceae bacterium]